MASSQDTEPFHWHFTDLDDRSFEIRGRTLFFIVVLFSIILLFTLIFFYARWVCRYHHPLTHAPPPRPPPPPQPQPRPLGLDSSTIKSLPIILHRSNSVSEEKPECCICLGVFEDSDKVKVLPLCQHWYHSECVDRWLSSHSSCPLCRASLRVESQIDSAIPSIVVQ